MTWRNIDPLSLDETIDEEKEEQDVEKRSASVWEHQELAQIPIMVLRGHTDAVTSCHFCFDDTKVLTSSHDKTATLWDTESGAALLVFERGHLSNISECALIPDKKRLITASWDKTLNAWDLETGKIIWTAAQAGLLTSCSVSEDGKYVVSSSDPENAICLTSADTGERLFHIKDHHKSTITRCRFDPQSQHVASVSEDRTIKLWDLVSTKTTLSINSTHTNVVSNCCFTANGRYLCTASWDKTLQLWDVQTGTFRSHGGLTLSKGHAGSVSSCTFSMDGSVLVSGAYDRTVAVWNMETLCKTLELKGHADWVTDVAISADKKWVASASKDATVRLWNTEHSEEIPAVIETRKAQGMGYHILQCEECGKDFSISRLENSDLVTKCVFCRLKTETRSHLQPPPLSSSVLPIEDRNQIPSSTSSSVV
ncbi:WD repeat-containing protein 88-like [Salvelinus alpinus]|uniref:WD repeat-containing protein 88-like n=1 Tax=Salvelinus alpinus TaxID=8036 RepID=UPI0039FC693E